jgi:hypothetical protein
MNKKGGSTRSRQVVINCGRITTSQLYQEIKKGDRRSLGSPVALIDARPGMMVHGFMDERTIAQKPESARVVSKWQRETFTKVRSP